MAQEKRAFEYIRSAYGVPARRGAPIKFNGRPGRVTSAKGGYVYLRLNGNKGTSGPYHPTWMMEWLEKEQAEQTGMVERK